MPKATLVLAKQIADSYGIDTPAIKWRKSRKKKWWTSGGYYPDEHRIVLTDGSKVVDRYTAFIHEMSHAVHHTHSPKEQTHGLNYWKLFWEMGEAYGANMKEALNRYWDIPTAMRAWDIRDGFRFSKKGR